jgi:hypothetical protein
MTKERESKIYQTILANVIWDEPRDEVFRIMKVNGIIGEDAQRLYKQAKADRVATIRSDALRRIGWGLLILLPSVALLFYMVKSEGSSDIESHRLPFLGISYGALLILWGTYSMILARIMRGSLSDLLD